MTKLSECENTTLSGELISETEREWGHSTKKSGDLFFRGQK